MAGNMPGRNNPVVVVCIDGSEPDYITEAIRAGAMPWMAQVIGDKGTDGQAADGRGIDLRGDCVIPSFTNPNNMSIVTGVLPEVHGICGNFYYDRETGVEIMMNDPALLRAPTLFKGISGSRRQNRHHHRQRQAQTAARPWVESGRRP